MTKTKLPPPYSTLEGVAAMLGKCDVQAAQKAIKKLMEELTSERAARNAEMLKELDGFVHRVLSPRGKKTPEEVAILPAVVKMLLKRYEVEA